jgi:uncharacterized protein (TIGR04255 family)
MREKLSHPPVIELIIGVYFKPPLLDLHNYHLGIFWEKIRDGYPRVEQRDPIGNLYIEVPGELFPMPRYWFTSKDETHLVQVQRNGFLLNWRKRNAEYPSYDPVKAEFDRVFNIFSTFIHSIKTEAQILVDRCELTYLNVIEKSDYWSGPDDTANVVPTYQSLGEYPIAAFNVQQAQNIDAITSIATALRTVDRKADSASVLQLEIRAAGQLGGKSKGEADAWFTMAHDLTGNTFRSLTNRDIRENHWNKGAPHAR